MKILNKILIALKLKKPKPPREVEGIYRNYKMYDEKGRRLAIFAKRKGTKVMFTVYTCSKQDSFNKKAAYKAYTDGNNTIEEDIIEFIKVPAGTIDVNDKVYNITKKIPKIKGTKKSVCNPQQFEAVNEDGTPIAFNIYELTNYVKKMFYIKGSIVKLVKTTVYANNDQKKAKILVEKPNGRVVEIA